MLDVSVKRHSNPLAVCPEVQTLCRQGRMRRVSPHSYSLRQTRQDT